MKVLGIDPGAGTGWCLYDASTCEVLSCGNVQGHEISDEMRAAIDEADAVATESFYSAHAGNIFPTTVESAYICGVLVMKLRSLGVEVHELLRIDIKRTLTDATFGEIRVKNDSTCWAALKLLHGGEGCDRKPRVRKGEVVTAGGPLGGVVSHARAALAVAVAWVKRRRGE